MFKHVRPTAFTCTISMRQIILYFSKITFYFFYKENLCNTYRQGRIINWAQWPWPTKNVLNPVVHR